MICTRTYLYPDNDKVWIDEYISDRKCPDGGRPAMLIFPGGAYQHLSKREAEPVAKEYLAHGFNVFVLFYTLTPDILDEKGFFKPLKDAAKAIAYVRKNCERLFVNPEKISVIGFSAGAHLAGLISTRWHTPELSAVVNEKNDDIKPDSAILAYAPVSAEYHKDWFCLLSGVAEPDAAMLEYFSNHLHVSEKTCPIFMWHTATDQIVAVENCLDMAKALRANNIDFELHVYPHGAHGLSVCTDEVNTMNEAIEHARAWVEASAKWLKYMKLS